MKPPPTQQPRNSINQPDRTPWENTSSKALPEALVEASHVVVRYLAGLAGSKTTNQAVVSAVEKQAMRTALKTRRNSGFICLRIGMAMGDMESDCMRGLESNRWLQWLRTQQICRVCEGFRLLEKLARDFCVVVLLVLLFGLLNRFRIASALLETSTSFRLFTLQSTRPNSVLQMFHAKGVVASQRPAAISDLRFR